MPWWFVAAALGMVVVALLFVFAPPRRRALTGAPGPSGRAPAGALRRRPATLVLLVLLPLLAVVLYLWLGDPAALGPDRGGLSAQLREADAALDGPAAEHASRELAQHLQRRPDDARARVVMARLDVRAQRFEQAAAGFERALQGTSKAAADAGLWVEYAEARGLQQGGTLAGQPRLLVDKALSLNPDHPQALDLAGSAAWEAGEFALTVTHWSRLLAQIPPGSPRHVQLATAIQRAEQRARFALPPAR